jgi:hypothetical protein
MVNWEADKPGTGLPSVSDTLKKIDILPGNVVNWSWMDSTRSLAPRFRHSSTGFPWPNPPGSTSKITSSSAFPQEITKANIQREDTVLRIDFIDK